LQEFYLEKKKFDDAISRAYCATYLSAFAVLFLKGEIPKSHSGLISLFGIRLVKAGIIPKEYAKILSELFNARQNSDYAVLVWFDEEDANRFIKKAEKFVSKMQEIINKMLE